MRRRGFRGDMSSCRNERPSCRAFQAVHRHQPLRMSQAECVRLGRYTSLTNGEYYLSSVAHADCNGRTYSASTENGRIKPRCTEARWPGERQHVTRVRHFAHRTHRRLCVRRGPGFLRSFAFPDLQPPSAGHLTASGRSVERRRAYQRFDKYHRLEIAV